MVDDQIFKKIKKSQKQLASQIAFGSLDKESEEAINNMRKKRRTKKVVGRTAAKLVSKIRRKNKEEKQH